MLRDKLPAISSALQVTRILSTPTCFCWVRHVPACICFFCNIIPSHSHPNFLKQGCVPNSEKSLHPAAEFNHILTLPTWNYIPIFVCWNHLEAIINYTTIFPIAVIFNIFPFMAHTNYYNSVAHQHIYFLLIWQKTGVILIYSH